MTLLTPLISLLMICVFSSLMFLGVRKVMLKELNFCVAEVSKIQVKHRKLTLSLLALNPYAKQLRRARIAAEAAYRTALLPQVKAAAAMALAAVKLAQKTLRGIQLSKLVRSYAFSTAMITQMIKNKYLPVKPPTGLQVKKTHADTDSPGYILKNNYTEKKKISFFKRYSLFKNTPKKLLRFIGVTDSYKNFNCGATLLEKEEKPWKVKLILDK